MTEDSEYFFNKRADRVYLSKSLTQKSYIPADVGSVQQIERPFRIISKVIECKEDHCFFKNGKEVSLRITHGERQEIKAKFYEDSRRVFTLQIQKYSRSSGAPHHTHFSFIGHEIDILYNFLSNIEILPINGDQGRRFDDRFVNSIVLSKEQALRILRNQPELVAELQKHDLSVQDLATLGRRRSQLQVFRKMLDDDDYFEERRQRIGDNTKTEAVWQSYFEENTWIFGYGLRYIFNSPIAGEKLEAVVRGHNVSGSGKRVDALLRTRGLIGALSFGEIKTHTSELMKRVSRSYRPECWQISDDLTGGIAQVQKTVQLSLQSIGSRLDMKKDDGSPTGEQLYNYQPKSFLVIGSLAEFKQEYGINEDKYSSFELFRRSIANPEIITFDELYERASYIVESSSDPASDMPGGTTPK